MEENGFNLRDDLSENIVELTKKVGNVTVQVVFQSRSPQLGEENEEEDESIPSQIQKSQEEGKLLYIILSHDFLKKKKNNLLTKTLQILQ